MYCNSRNCNARQTQGFASRSLPLFFLHTLPVQCFTRDKIQRNECKLVACPQVTYLLLAGTALKMTVTKKGEQNRFSASTCVTALSSRGWVLGGWGGWTACKAKPSANGKHPLGRQGWGGSRSPPGRPPQQFHTKPISLRKKHAGRLLVRMPPVRSFRLRPAIKWDKVWVCLLLWVYLGSGAAGGEGGVPAPGLCPVLPGLRLRARREGSRQHPMPLGPPWPWVCKDGQAQGGKNAFLLRREGMVGMDPGPGAGRGNVAAGNGSNSPLRHVLGSSAGLCCPELRGTRSGLSLSCLQPGRGLPRSAGLLLRKEKTFKRQPRVVEQG